MVNKLADVMILNKAKIYVLLSVFLIFSPVIAQKSRMERLEHKLLKSMTEWKNPLTQWEGLGRMQLDSLNVDEASKEVVYYFNAPLSYVPWRNESVDEFVQSLELLHKRKLKHYTIRVFTNGYEICHLVPNLFRSGKKVDTDRIATVDYSTRFIVRESDEIYSKGLDHNIIALWHSHGWYYESRLDRWEWQRARLFGSVEDMLPMAYVLPYLVSMLEKSGANVFLPRERCIQKNEIIIDNDWSFDGAGIKLAEGLAYSMVTGFAYMDTLYTGDNPFEKGTAYHIFNGSGKVASYKCRVNESGEYAVYVSYRQDRNNSDQVKYVINHSGGSTSFLLNQTMGGGTWIYLGTYRFISDNEASVEVYANGQVSLDAIRLGGGMGNVARKSVNEVDSDIYKWKTSGRPRYMEAARYWLQYAGMSDTLVYSLNDEKNDYNDDYQSRGEWVNYLMGGSHGMVNQSSVSGLNLPVDLAFALHTDAGVTSNDSVIGTLGIFSTVRDGGVFFNGQSKLASRDLADIIQTQIVDDVRALYNEKWTRRGLWDKQYSEAWRPNVPVMLLELLSHQNIADMKYGLDPNFRFDVSRAIYKGMLKFQAGQEQRDYVVQPLAVDHMAINKTKGGYRLTWKPVVDLLEPTAVPQKYKVYQRINENGFDNGVIVDDTFYDLPACEKGQILSFKVTAINEGGESFPGEILSVGIADVDAETVLIVNAFDRVSAPAVIEEGDFAGVAWWDDQGVPDKYDLAFTGFQYDYYRQSKWLDDDSPGWGASYGDCEGKPLKGNSFDNIIIHGQSILKAGYSFVSVSDEVFESNSFDASSYKAVDIILGEEKSTLSYRGTEYDYKIYTPGMIEKIEQLTRNGQNILMSGAYIGTEMHLMNDTLAQKFAAKVLHFSWRTNHAVRNGQVYSTDDVSGIINRHFAFNTSWHPEVYTVEAPDAIEPEGKNAMTAFRYKENNASAGIMYKGDYKAVILGFPLETVLNDNEQRDKVFKNIMDFLMRN